MFIRCAAGRSGAAGSFGWQAVFSSTKPDALKESLVWRICFRQDWYPAEWLSRGWNLARQKSLGLHPGKQVVVDEVEFQRSAAEWAMTLVDSHVVGVWEERMPLSLHASLTLGCVAELRPHVRQRSLAEGFALDELRVRV